MNPFLQKDYISYIRTHRSHTYRYMTSYVENLQVSLEMQAQLKVTKPANLWKIKTVSQKDLDEGREKEREERQGKAIENDRSNMSKQGQTTVNLHRWISRVRAGHISTYMEIFHLFSCTKGKYIPQIKMKSLNIIYANFYMMQNSSSQSIIQSTQYMHKISGCLRLQIQRNEYQLKQGWVGNDVHLLFSKV